MRQLDREVGAGGSLDERRCGHDVFRRPDVVLLEWLAVDADRHADRVLLSMDYQDRRYSPTLCTFHCSKAGAVPFLVNFETQLRQGVQMWPNIQPNT
jgi:hypothetical protein